MLDRSRSPGHTSKAKSPGKLVKESKKKSKLEWLAVLPVNMPDLSLSETGMPLHARQRWPSPGPLKQAQPCSILA